MRRRNDQALWLSGALMPRCLVALTIVWASPAWANLLVNPGFEDGENGWSFYDNGGQGNQFVTTDDKHSGNASAALLLRVWGGYVGQDVVVDLPVGTVVTATWWMRMPHEGSHDNKWYGLGLTSYDQSDVDEGAGFEQFAAVPNWVQQSVSLTLTRPSVRLRVENGTGAGDGSYTGRDRPVYVDDFVLTVDPPQVASIPEPATLALLGIGALGLLRRRRGRSAV